MFKIINKMWPVYISKKMTFNYQNARKNSSRNRNNFEIPKAKNNCTQNTLFYKDISLYSAVPLIQNARDRSTCSDLEGFWFKGFWIRELWTHACYNNNLPTDIYE